MKPKLIHININNKNRREFQFYFINSYFFNIKLQKINIWFFIAVVLKQQHKSGIVINTGNILLCFRVLIVFRLLFFLLFKRYNNFYAINYSFWFGNKKLPKIKF